MAQKPSPFRAFIKDAEATTVDYFPNEWQWMYSCEVNTPKTDLVTDALRERGNLIYEKRAKHPFSKKDLTTGFPFFD